MAQPNQNHQPGQNPAPKTPTGGDRAPVRNQNETNNKSQVGRSDNMATSDEKPDEPRRYDEADPNWRNPDVQMQNQNSDKKTSKDTLI